MSSFFDDLGSQIADVEEVRNSWITEPGNYAARVTGIEETESKAGDPMLVISYEITEGATSGSSQKDRLTYTRDRNDPDFDKKMGYIKARFIDLGMPQDYSGPMDIHMFDGVEVILTMVYQREKKSNPGGHINPSTGKPYVQIGSVTTRNKTQAAQAAPAIPDVPVSSGFFN